MNRLLSLVVILTGFHAVYGQKKTSNPADSLVKRPYSYFQEQLAREGVDTTKALVYLDAWVRKAKQEGERVQQATAYKTMLFYVSNPVKLSYADTLIQMAKAERNGSAIGEAYMIKGVLYNREHKLGKALDHYLLSARYTDSTSDEAGKFRNKLSIATVKYQLGFYEESLQLSKSCNNFFAQAKNRGDGSSYLVSLYNTAMVYSKLGRHDLSFQYSKEGADLTSKLGYPDFVHFFQYSRAQNLYYSRQYQEALDAFAQVNKDVYMKQDPAKQATAKMYMGLCYWEMGDREQAVSYLKAAEEWVSHSKGVRLELMPTFTYLVDYYKVKGDEKQQLHYIRNLIHADSIIQADYKYMSVRIHREYDTKELQAASRQLESQLRDKTREVTFLWVSLALISVATAYYAVGYFRKKKSYKKRFDQIITGGIEPVPALMEVVKDKKPDINPEVVKAIKQQLDLFENNRGFLKTDLTVVNLAASFNTNANYLSKIINYYRGKPYAAYLNELRINYCIQMLRENPTVRKYSIKALAEECGFKTAQHFSKAFHGITGLYPSFFLSELEKQPAEVVEVEA